MNKKYIAMLALVATALVIYTVMPEQKIASATNSATDNAKSDKYEVEVESSERKEEGTDLKAYEETSSATDVNGTTTKIKNSTNITVDKEGTKKITTQSETTEDPKGLMNKVVTEKSKYVTEEK